LRTANRVAAICFIVFSAAVVWASLSLEYYTKLGPGAGFFPFWLGVAMGVLSLVWLGQVCTQGAVADAPLSLPDRLGATRIVAIVGSVAAAALFMNVFGYQAVMFLLLLFWLRVLGRQPLLVTLAVAAAGSVGVYRVFTTYLDVPLPAASLALLNAIGL
jgi:putative tricarboxylic transport membrane protein